MATGFKADFTFNQDAFSGLHPDTMPSIFDEPRYSAPRACKDVPEELTNYAKAEDMARGMALSPGCRHYQMVSGGFIFGDFIEALLREQHIQAVEMTISTYSLSRNNIDSLRGLMDSGHIEKLSLIISAGQHSHELHGLVPYALEQLDLDNRFQYAAAGTHCKLCIFETLQGNKVVMHGSANLRSSGNIEQFMLEENPALYDFNHAYQQRILTRYGVINHNKPLRGTKPLRHSALWAEVAPESTP
ncbi:hypothetical protein [Hymenobacter ruber]